MCGLSVEMRNDSNQTWYFEKAIAFLKYVNSKPANTESQVARNEEADSKWREI